MQKKKKLTLVNKNQVQFILILFFNIVVAFYFLSSNLNLWNSLNNFGSGYYSQYKWGPISIDIFQFVFLQNGPKLAATFSYINSPFILFWISTIGNLLFIMWILLNKETKPTS